MTATRSLPQIAKTLCLATLLCVFSPAPAVHADPADDVLPKQVLILEVYATSNTGKQTVTFPKDVILQTITVVPASIDTHPDLFNCGAMVRWPHAGKSGVQSIDPASTGSILLDHNWGGANHISLNYALPYELVLPKGTQLEAQVGRIGWAGSCDASIVFTGTTF